MQGCFNKSHHPSNNELFNLAVQTIQNTSAAGMKLFPRPLCGDGRIFSFSFFHHCTSPRHQSNRRVCTLALKTDSKIFKAQDPLPWDSSQVKNHIKTIQSVSCFENEVVSTNKDLAFASQALNAKARQKADFVLGTRWWRISKRCFTETCTKDTIESKRKTKTRLYYISYIVYSGSQSECVNYTSIDSHVKRSCLNSIPVIPGGKGREKSIKLRQHQSNGNKRETSDKGGKRPQVGS